MSQNPTPSARISARIARDRRVRDARRRRQGQGPQGRRPPGHRLRRRRARLPDARLHRRGRRRGVRRPGEPPLHPRRPACPSCAQAIAAKTLRDSGYEVDAATRCWSPTAASRPSTRRSPRCSIPGDEVLLPAPYWTTYPEAIRLAGGVPVEVFAGDDQGYLVTVEQLEAARTARAPRRCCSSPRPTRPAPSTRREQTEAIGRWALEHGIWVVTDEIYEHLTYDGVEASPHGRGRARARRHDASCSTASPRPTR